MDSQEKAKIRHRLFTLNESLSKANEKLFQLKRIQRTLNK